MLKRFVIVAAVTLISAGSAFAQTLPSNPDFASGSNAFAGTPGSLASASDIRLSMSDVYVHILAPGGSPLPTDAHVQLYEVAAGMDSRARGLSSSGYGGQTLYEASAKKSVAAVGYVMGGEYVLEVSAPGYELHREKLTVIPGASTRAFVKLHVFDGSSDDIELEQNGVPPLPGMARRYLELGQVSLKQNKYKDASGNIQKALKSAPQNPDIHFMAGYLAEQMKDTAAAKTQYETAVKLFPNHFGAQLALGQALLFNSDPNGAIPHFEKAIAVGPNSWRGHWLLAEAYLQGPRDAERAEAEAKRAVEVGKEKATSALVTEAIAEAIAGQRDEAKQELEAFLHNYPSSIQANRAKDFLAQLESNATTAIATPLSAKEVDPLDLESVAPEDVPGLPADVDSAVPPVTQGETCELPQVLAGAAARAQEFTSNLERFSAKEMVTHSLLDAKGVPKNPKNQPFDYVVSVDRTPADFVRFEEIRNGKYAVENFPGEFAVEGIPALIIVFHPKMSGDFKFTCEGLGERGGKPAWQVRWEQRTDRPARLHSWDVQGSEYPALLKGRAWLSASSYQLLHMDVDLVQGIKPLRLEYQHMSVDYAPVNFPDKKRSLWLPSNVVVYCKYQGHYFRQEHDYSDFTLFSTGVDEKQGTIKKN